MGAGVGSQFLSVFLFSTSLLSIQTEMSAAQKALEGGKKNKVGFK